MPHGHIKGPLLISLQYYGAACWKIDYNGQSILIDPGHHYYSGLKPHEAKKLDNIDIICLTHMDFDHFNSLKHIPYKKNQVVIGLEEFQNALSQINNFHTIKHSQTIEINNIKIKSLKVNHGLRHTMKHSGYMFFFNDLIVAHLGDGIDVDEAVSPYCLLLDIGGMECNINNAYKLIKRLKPSVVYPMHWEFFPPFYKRPYKLKKIVETNLNGIKVIKADKNNIYELSLDI